MDTYAIWTEVDRLMEFDVTSDHLTLLKHAYVRWSEVEFGAPEIDGKRPYGNSNVLHDIAELIEPEFGKDDLVNWDTWIDRNEERLTRLHVETALALQIVLLTGEFRPGTYRKANQYADRSWHRIDGEGD
ncbi:MAG TPA: hypothetical protein VGW74_04005 [Propionibacteriaceae bacterium]|nr:hypothetical protein [Propionibacteriaceae bacterium]